MNERICCINHYVLKNVQRPSIYFEANQEKGDRSVWSAITFKAQVNPFDFIGEFSRITLNITPQESWLFFNAKIALMPGSCMSDDHYVMIFDSCERKCDELPIES